MGQGGQEEDIKGNFFVSKMLSKRWSRETLPGETFISVHIGPGDIDNQDGVQVEKVLIYEWESFTPHCPVNYFQCTSCRE